MDENPIFNKNKYFKSKNFSQSSLQKRDYTLHEK